MHRAAVGTDAIASRASVRQAPEKQNRPGNLSAARAISIPNEIEEATLPSAARSPYLQAVTTSLQSLAGNSRSLPPSASNSVARS
jgi:hypothetical protein